MRFEISIDELVLRGVPAEQAAAVAAAVERRLDELAAGSATTGSAAPGSAGDVSLECVRTRPVRAAGAAALGDGIAERVWCAVGGEGERG